MPRSGTTLTEQILSAHSQIQGAGERKELADILIRFLDNSLPNWLDQETILQNSDPIAVKKIGETYQQLLEKEFPDAQHIIDKMPANFKNVGLIKVLFPDAVIINCRRNPMDTILSCYFQQFSDRTYYSFRLDALVEFFNIYNQYMRFWLEMFDDIFVVKYEDVVADARGQMEKILSALGLDWEDAMDAHHKSNKRVPKTASHWQARQPIYNRSVERWRKYEKHIGYLAKLVEDDFYTID
jgi:hypothetical protein